MRSSIALRTRVLGAFFIAAALLLITRLYFVQVMNAAKYQRSAVAQYVADASDNQDRGSIFLTTKNGESVAGALMRSGWRIAIQPQSIENAEAAYSALNSVSPIDRDKFMEIASRKSDPYEEIAFRLSDDTANAVRDLKIPGVLLVSDQWRFYPGHELAANVIGFVGYKGDTRTGVYGLERSYQDTLFSDSSNLYVNPFAEIFTNIESILSFNPAEHKGSIVTSIEPQVQQQLETTLQGVMKAYTPEFAGGIVMDPHTGEIIAMADKPTFDPNTYNLETDVSVFANRLVEGRYELGSIMKPLTMAAGIDSGAVSLSTKYKDTGCAEFSTYMVCDYDQKARGMIPMQEVLSQSLNLGSAFIASKIGYPLFTTYLRAYGFGDRTKIDLPNEVLGDISTLGEGDGPAVNYATAAFGQGIAVSPIQMIRALSSLANSGVLPSPHVVTGVKFENGVTRAMTFAPGPIVLKPETAEIVTAMLIKVFDEALSNGKFKMDHYTVAAKTGTAQIPKPGGGYYPPGTYLHSFFGYFPAHDPRFIIFLFTFKPQGQTYASATLAEPFVDITKFLINYYNIPPDR